MANNSRNNYISIAKALGIILMVVGHSGCPSAFGRFIYLFHMPLFFVCSGYFFKEITNRTTLIAFYKKKYKGLYVPYLKWSILFLLLHNIFFNLNIYNSLSNSYQYQYEDFVIQFLKIVAMTDYELLIRPFWFIKELLLSSILVSTISCITSGINQEKKIEFIWLIMILLSIFSKIIRPIPIIGDASVLLFSIVYFYTGILLNKYKNHIRFTYLTFIICFITVFIGSHYYIGSIDMRYTTIYNIIPYYLLSISGIIMTFCASTKLETTIINKTLYYIGNHTIYILVLNLLALKLGNLIKIWIYNMPIERLSSYTIITEHNSCFWVIYSMIGILSPLFVEQLYRRFILKLKNSIYNLYRRKK